MAIGVQSVLILGSSLALGYGAICTLKVRMHRFETAAASVLVGLLGWSWLALLLSLVMPYAIAVPLAIVIGLAVGAALVVRARRSALPKSLEVEASSHVWWVIFSVLSAFALGSLLFSHALRPENGTLVSGAAAWADYGLHVSLITHLVSVPRIPLDLPIASGGVALTYPFLVDFYSALLYRGGMTLQYALAVPGTLLAMALVQLFIGLSLRLFRSMGGALVGISLALLGGAAGSFAVIRQDLAASGSLGAYLATIPRDYTSLDSLNLHFNNIVADIIIPQRGFLFGMGAFALIAILLNAYVKDRQIRWLYAAGLLLGLLPLAHPHSFLVTGALVAAFGLRGFILRERGRIHYVGALAIAAILALPQVIYVTTANGNGTGAHFSLGWMVQPGQSLASFYWANFGTVGIFMAGLLVAMVAVRRWRRYLTYYAPLATVFIAAQIYSLQPFAYDNLKLMLYAFIIAMLFAGALAVRLVRRHKAWLLLFVPLFIVWSLPGSLTVLREYQLHDQFASADDIALADWARNQTPADSVFASADSTNQPVMALAGRPVVAGYRGWLYSYNLPYTDRIQALENVMAGGDSRLLQERYEASYLVVSQFDSAAWPVNRPALQATYQVVYANPTWTVYRLPEVRR